MCKVGERKARQTGTAGQTKRKADRYLVTPDGQTDKEGDK